MNWQDIAINAADEYCECKEGEPCEARSFRDGYLAGVSAGIEAAAKICAEECEEGSAVKLIRALSDGGKE